MEDAKRRCEAALDAAGVGRTTEVGEETQEGSLTAVHITDRVPSCAPCKLGSGSRWSACGSITTSTSPRNCNVWCAAFRVGPFQLCSYARSRCSKP